MEPAMVFWVVCKDELSGPDVARYGPFESEAVAKKVIADLRARWLATTTRIFQVVCDFA